MTQTNSNNHKPKNEIDPRFIKNIDGKDFVLYNGLLNTAHENGLKSLEVEVVQYPTVDNGNTVICHAKATDESGRIFSEIADANDQNVDEKMKPHYIRIAATRAKARCLRDFNNVAMTCLEELGADTTVVPNVTGEPKYPSSKTEKAEPKPSTPSSSNSSTNQNPIPLPQQNQAQSNSSDSNQNVSMISPAQKNAIENLAQRNKMNMDELNKLTMDTYGCNLEELTSLNSANLIRLLQKSA